MNPELQRNLWLEVTLHRLILIPGVIFAVAALVHAIHPTGLVISKMAMAGFLAATMVWGARQAANSVLEEARTRTWDIQRMCALSAWRMTWGKLLGATAMYWYAGLCCLLLYIGSGDTAAIANDMMTMVLVVTVTVLAHALALIGALVGLHRGSGLQSRLANILVVGLSMFMLPIVLNLVDSDATLRWYQHAYKRLPFSMITALLFASCAVLGATRAMSMELKIGTRPVVWLAFSGIVAVFVGGFADIAATPSLPLLRCFSGSLCVTAIVQTYLAAFAYPRDPMQLRRSERALTSRRYRRALEELPLWPVSAALALAAALLATSLGTTSELTLQRLDNLGPVSLAATLMMLRDVALLSYFSMSMRRGVPEATTLIYICILDGLLPALLPHLGLGALTPLLWPPFFTAPVTAIIILSVHAAVALLLALHAYRDMLGGISKIPGG